MADNYLERKMEDLRSGRMAIRTQTSRPTSSTITSSRYDGLAVVIVGGASELGIKLAKDFRAKGASVDIIDSDWRSGQIAAQQSGSTFHPADITDKAEIDIVTDKIKSSRGHIDISICI